MPSMLGILVVLCYALFIAVMVRVAFSWIGPNPGNPVYRLSFQLTEPFLGPIRRLLPATGGVDFSPMILTFVLFMVLNLLQRAGG